MRDEGGGTEDRAHLGMTFSCQKTGVGSKALIKRKTGWGENQNRKRWGWIRLQIILRLRVGRSHREPFKEGKDHKTRKFLLKSWSKYRSQISSLQCPSFPSNSPLCASTPTRNKEYSRFKSFWINEGLCQITRCPESILYKDVLKIEKNRSFCYMNVRSLSWCFVSFDLQ